MKFTEIPDKLKYPPNVKAKLSTLHSSVVTYVSDHFERRYDYRKRVISTMNTLSYMCLFGEPLSSNWQESNPLEHITIVDDDTCKSSLGDLYLTEKNLVWDVTPSESVQSSISTGTDNLQSIQFVSESVNSTNSEGTASSKFDVSGPLKIHNSLNLTPKEDLYIKPPVVPQFDVTKPWKFGMIGNEKFVIYSSLPEIPTKQNEISATTDVNKITSPELMNLYPNQFIRTRASCMYEPIPGLDYDEKLGLILPIDGYSVDQVRDNIVKYPHIFKLTRVVDGKIVSLYTTIEIDGELFNTLSVWNSLPESSLIPRTSEFVKEYVVRRYLLERDVKGLKHNYPLNGSLDPFLTLFTTPDEYIQLGYSDILGMAKQCVISRVRYKQTRNPILRRLNNA